VQRDAPTELSAVRVRLRVPAAERADGAVGAATSGDARTGRRPAHFGAASGHEFVETDVFRRDRLRSGDELSGPAIVEGAVDTVVVPPGWHAVVDDRRGLRLLQRAST
jgi:N-methylhydantoinase A/oxoprolinase/acetone carboxylase beta subunit